MVSRTGLLVVVLSADLLAGLKAGKMAVKSDDLWVPYSDISSVDETVAQSAAE